MKPWYLDPERTTQMLNKLCVNVATEKLHDFTETVCDEIWRKGDLYCHRERMYANGCVKECSLCRPNN